MTSVGRSPESMLAPRQAVMAHSCHPPTHPPTVHTCCVFKPHIHTPTSCCRHGHSLMHSLMHARMHARTNTRPQVEESFGLQAAHDILFLRSDLARFVHDALLSLATQQLSVHNLSRGPTYDLSWWFLVGCSFGRVASHYHQPTLPCSHLKTQI
jgi:hypothetical protein